MRACFAGPDDEPRPELRLPGGDGGAGYAVLLLSRFGSATVRALRVPSQPTNLHPGPTVAIDQPLAGRGRASFTVRLLPSG